MGDFEKFREEWEDKGDGILYPAFHGTNGTAASMILRFGFAVLSREELIESGGKYAGSMLGPGVYSAPNIDKIANYVGEDNYGRLGSVGYVFLMDETLGENGTHYRSAGLGDDIIRSPEYCAKFPREQIKIMKCFKAVKSSLKYISSSAKKHGVELNESFEKQIWDNVIMEQSEETENNGYTTFIFMENLIPINNKSAYPIEKLTFDSNISVGSCQDGIEIIIPNNVGKINMFKISDTYHEMNRNLPAMRTFIEASRGLIKK